MLTCKTCKADISWRPTGSLYCLPCGRHAPRVGAPERKRPGIYAALKIDGQRVCRDCRVPLEPVAGGGGSIRCRACGITRDRAFYDRRAPAATAVAQAIREGQLKRPSEFACVDCGQPAKEYDHRDYTKPLDVVPVCRSCNVLRGPALFPPLPFPIEPAKAA